MLGEKRAALKRRVDVGRGECESVALQDHRKGSLRLNESEVHTDAGAGPNAKGEKCGWIVVGGLLLLYVAIN